MVQHRVPCCFHRTIIFASFIPSTHPLQFNFGTFKPSMQELRYEGDAYSDQQALQFIINELGNTQDYSLGRATTQTPCICGTTLPVSFDMYTKDQNDTGDGLAFFLAQNGSVPQSGGGHLGLFPPSPDPSSPHIPTIAVRTGHKLS